VRSVLSSGDAVAKSAAQGNNILDGAIGSLKCARPVVFRLLADARAARWATARSTCASRDALCTR
jgi:hypothetical protein